MYRVYSKGTEVNLSVGDEGGLRIHLEDEDSAKSLLEYLKDHTHNVIVMENK